jgi:ribonucleoside-triphosphate reductase (formate)
MVSDMAKEIKCPQCGSKNVDGISRVVGYFSLIKNWNKSKQGELKARKKGNYKLESSE